MIATARLSPSECAAVFVMLLDDDQAAGLLSRLPPEQLQRVGAIMCDLGDIEPHRIAAAISGFVAEAQSETLGAHSRAEKVGTLMNRAVGEMRGGHMMRRIRPDAAPRSIEMARWLAPPILAALVADEHPQVVAVLLLLLDPDDGAQVLAALPRTLQPRVVERIARLGEVPGEAITMLDELLTVRIAGTFGASTLKVGGARDAANLINLSHPEMGGIVLPDIETRDRDLASAIEAEMFTFAMLFDLDAKDMGRVLRDVDSQDLIAALKGVDETDREPFFAAMSTRAAQGVRDEMELLPKLKRSDVLDAQKTIVDLARVLADDGEIALGAGDGEFV